ncbi:hypothetical protein FYK55_17370 [Roseiconus nitratireducens]|uniref:Dolichyl-phosphate-mannose-protein mannosyltransferase n=1 Tax=Roseiconus nitratireducens TaxID=2605748 RepID=A0A5M6D843_9BACT|nr:hypothetical protein [Roseiconus nitratireducens]KAA5541345.1 hypothetical protein FYK55_17370 [Roseiconus nitratireducens]
MSDVSANGNDPARSLSFPMSRSAIGVCIAGLTAMYLFRTTIATVDPDMWHELTLARETLRRGTVPWENFSAYTTTVYPSVHHEWGAGMIAYPLVQFFGSTGIVILRFLLCGATAWICWRNARENGATVAILSFLAPVAILMADKGFSPVRAQMYTYMMTALLLGWLRRDQRGDRKWIALWLILFLMWVNLHAGFLVGAGFFALEWLERVFRGLPSRHLLATGLVMIPAIAVNPYGWHYYGYLLHAVTLDRPLVDEWHPIWADSFHHQLLFSASLLLLLYAVKHRLSDDLGLPIVAVAAIEAALHQRMLAIYAIAWVIHVPGWINRTELGSQMNSIWSRRETLLKTFWGLIAVGFFALWIGGRPWAVRIPGTWSPVARNEVVYPVGPVKYLRTAGRKANLLTPFDSGAFVTWKLYPQVLVSLDGRYEVGYPPELATENWNLYMARDGWQAALERFPTDLILVPRTLPLAKAIRQCSDWKQVYGDDGFTIFAPADQDWPIENRRGETFEGQIP